ncbi:putative Pyridoxal kinase [Blattamonas nauphoetae]|uniref:pyridoxal kinase n=1 Tax=Blattamonas nauphoetae TaxID=2049346 RepID=A0ABQ9XK65_9EUKA|nr:putative Pyridoxal kinase [Blattamonas nauphoetae]
MTHPNKQILQFLKETLKNIIQTPSGLVFAERVNPELLQIPTYRQIITRPMDFGTICRKIDYGEYNDSVDDVIHDIFQTFDNCYHFNAAQNPVSIDARKIQSGLLKRLRGNSLIRPYQIELIEKAQPRRWWKTPDERYSEEELLNVEPLLLGAHSQVDPETVLTPIEGGAQPLTIEETELFYENIQRLSHEQLSSLCTLLLNSSVEKAKISGNKLVQFDLDSLHPLVQRHLFIYAEQCLRAPPLATNTTGVHVVFGNVGNKCAQPIFFLNQIPADFLHTVQLSAPSNYPGHPGTRMQGPEFKELADGLQTNKLLNYAYVITGYIGQPSLLKEVASCIAKLRTNERKPLFVCDPVMGDNGHYYVSSELTEIYQQDVIGQADILLPNLFEFESLARIPIRNKADVFKGFQRLHGKYGTSVIILKSIRFDEDGNRTDQSIFDIDDLSSIDYSGVPDSKTPSSPSPMMTLYCSILNSMRDDVGINHNEDATPHSSPLCSPSPVNAPSQSTDPQHSIHSFPTPPQSPNTSASFDQTQSFSHQDVSNSIFSINFPYVHYNYGGTGDCFAALLLSNLIKLRCENDSQTHTMPSFPLEGRAKFNYHILKLACENAITALNLVIQKTDKFQQQELMLMESQEELKSSIPEFFAIDEK